MSKKNLFAALVVALSILRSFSQSVPLVTVTTPTNGATYFAPANIYLRAESSDTNGIAFTQIIADDNFVGSAKTNVFVTVWTNAPMGTHVIRGEAMNNVQIRGTSAPVTITILSNPYPQVSIATIDSHAAEPGDDTGSIKVSRTGDVSTNLTVFYTISGTASNGVDYVQLPDSIMIPAGSSNATILIQPIDDSILEPTENVTLVLRTNAAYQFTSTTGATVNIFDNETNHPPTITITSPQTGTVLSDPDRVVLTAEASDIDGNPPTVTFLRNQVYIGAGIKGVSNNVYTLVWTNVPAGDFSLTALARDGLNQAIVTTSAPVALTITRTNLAPYVYVSTPTNGRVFTNVTAITLAANAYPGAASRHITGVDLMVGTNVIASVTNTAGSGLYYTQWSNPPPGNYEFTARARDDAGGVSVTPPANFTILSIQTVTITATDNHAAEPGNDTGLFTVSRSGNLSEALVVFYSISGTASNGVDYVTLPNNVTIPAGASTATIVVQPIDDTAIESTEAVTLTLVNASTPPSYSLGSPATATVYLYDNDTNTPPTVTLIAPTNGAAFTTPTNILLQAEAHDNGYVTGVAFYQGTNWIGSSYGSSNSTSPLFSVLWTNPPAGEYVITARAYDNVQKSATSAPVQITITAGTVSNVPPTVSLYYPTNGASFRSPTNIEVTAIASDSDGTVATVQFFANDASLGIVTNNPVSTQPANVFHLTWNNPSPGNYALTAKATDNQGATKTSVANNVTVLPPIVSNQPPTVTIVSPSDHSVFYGPTNITVTAEASDSDGSIARVYFFAGSSFIGVATNAPYTVTWTNAAPGNYNLTARAIDNGGAGTTSAGINVTIRSLTEFSFVTRSVPLWYVPGVKLTVKLLAYPKTNTTTYSAQDFPPPGWVINSVGENGHIDTGGQSVTFGPFNDKLSRSFSYTVTPPISETGVKQFVGTGTANDFTSPIVGVSSINQAQPHPADLNPTNFFIGTNELDAYTLAWKRCEKWPISPSPVPVNYLTRAGYIVAGGGNYFISSNYPTPLAPLIWVRNATTDATATTLTNGVPWTASSYGSAVASMPTNYFSNVTFTVTINVSPVPSCSAYAVEDRPPEGWVVSNVSDGGFYCPILKKVKWGLYLDNQARSLTYQITPSTNILRTASFSGVASFDGIDVPISGKRYTTFTAGAVPPAKLQSIISSPNGDRIITFLGQPGVVYRLEGSVDLINWAPMESLLNNDGVLYYTDPAGTNFDNRFYRAIPTDGN